MATTPSAKRLRTSRSNTRKFWHIEDTRTLEELDERVGHIQRVSDGLSDPKLGTAHPADKFSSAYSQLTNVYQREELRELEREFLQADFDADSKLNRQEMKYWMEKHIEPITESEAKSLMDRFDPDKDDTLDFKEFVALCANIGYKKSKTVALNVKKVLQTSNAADNGNDESVQNSSLMKQSPSCGLAPCNGASANSKGSSNRSLKSSRSQDGALEVDNSKADAIRNKSRSINSSRSFSRKRGNVKEIITCFEKKIHKLMQEAAASRMANDTLSRKARTKSRNRADEAAMLHTTAANAVQDSKVDEMKPPLPPPMPESPLFEVTKPLKSKETENQYKLQSSSSSTTTGPQPWPLPSPDTSQRSHSNAKKAREQPTSNKPKDKLDEFQILKKSNESSRTAFSNTLPVEMAKEAKEQQHQQRRFSEPNPSGTSKDTPVASYNEERVLAKFSPLVMTDASGLEDLKNMKQPYESPLDAVFEKGPRALNQNHFVFPNVYKGAVTRNH